MESYNKNDDSLPYCKNDNNGAHSFGENPKLIKLNKDIINVTGANNENNDKNDITGPLIQQSNQIAKDKIQKFLEEYTLLSHEQIETSPLLNIFSRIENGNIDQSDPLCITCGSLTIKLDEIIELFKIKIKVALLESKLKFVVDSIDELEKRYPKTCGLHAADTMVILMESHKSNRIMNNPCPSSNENIIYLNELKERIDIVQNFVHTFEKYVNLLRMEALHSIEYTNENQPETKFGDVVIDINELINVSNIDMQLRLLEFQLHEMGLEEQQNVITTKSCPQLNVTQDDEIELWINQISRTRSEFNINNCNSDFHDYEKCSVLKSDTDKVDNYSIGSSNKI